MKKLAELKSVIGQECSENFSPTNRAKLISINEYYNVCTMEVVESNYPSHSFSAFNKHMVGIRYQRPVEYVWNAFFF